MPEIVAAIGMLRDGMDLGREFPSDRLSQRGPYPALFCQGRNGTLRGTDIRFKQPRQFAHADGLIAGDFFECAKNARAALTGFDCHETPL
jgi:hypothetical protein